MSKDLTQGRPFRVLLQFSLPVIAGNLFQLFTTIEPPPDGIGFLRL